MEFFEHDNFRGHKDTYTGAVRQVRNNDKMSSLKVGGGCCAIIYEHGNFQGHSKQYCTSTKFVGGWWNDKVSSVKVVRRGDEPEEELDEEEQDVEDEEDAEEE